jgi:hypothetical protein
MRLSYSSFFGALGVAVGLLATAAIAGAAEPKPAPAAPKCGCASHRPITHVHYRPHARVWRGPTAESAHYGYVDHVVSNRERLWVGQRDLGQGRWAYDQEARVMFWDVRPWATDRYGYLTWPGKTHFIDGHPIAGEFPPPPPPEGVPPPEGWQGPPPPPGDGESYDIQRF